jgi:hypothetical protein
MPIIRVARMLSRSLTDRLIAVMGGKAEGVTN